MLNLVFFARVKEQLNCGSVTLEWNESLATFAGLQDYLSKTNGPAWGDVLTQDNIIRAVNHCVVEEDAVLSDGDEVAYFPPVTGG